MVHQATEVVEQLSWDVTLKQTISATPALYKTILSFSGLDERDKQPERISQEGFVLLIAGSDTTARVLANGVFFILSNRTTILHRLQNELVQVMPEPDTKASWQELEQLPWLVSCGDLPSFFGKY
jgi:cytochrome P450